MLHLDTSKTLNDALGLGKYALDAEVASSVRKLLRLLAPQTQESPIFFHLTSSEQVVFDSAIEQMSATG